MRRFKKILFLADGSKGEKAALRRAADLAINNKARLTLFDVVDVEDYGTLDTRTATKLKALDKSHIQERRKELVKLSNATVSKHPGLRITVDVQVGDLARSAIRAVLVKRHDLIIKAPRANGGKLKNLFGGSDQKLIRKCPCPVWIVKPIRRKRFRRILAAVDLHANDAGAKSLAKQVMSLSTSLAKDERSDLHVVHAWEFKNAAKLRARGVGSDIVAGLTRDIKAAHESEINKLVGHYRYDKKTVHVIKGRAGDVIPTFVEEFDIDLIVIGTVGRGGVPGLLIGNTAENVLNAVDCSVLMLKPEGFETPIQL